MSSSNQNQQSGGQPSSSSSSSSSSAASSSSGGKGGETAYRLPSNVCLQHSCKLAIVQDKPVMMDYWTASLDKSIIIGVRENGEKLLIKSEDEYTSPIANIYKVETEYIIVTENSIYLISVDTPSKRINN
jgi:hypothetical protein